MMAPAPPCTAYTRSHSLGYRNADRAISPSHVPFTKVWMVGSLSALKAVHNSCGVHGQPTGGWKWSLCSSPAWRMYWNIKMLYFVGYGRRESERSTRCTCAIEQVLRMTWQASGCHVLQGGVP